MRKVIVVAVVAMVVVLVVFPRMVPRYVLLEDSYGYVYRLDRWTGGTQAIEIRIHRFRPDGGAPSVLSYCDDLRRNLIYLYNPGENAGSIVVIRDGC